MHVKTYTGSDLAAALRRARSELGPNALVLATREVTGRLGLSSVEITVGLDRDPGPGGDPARPILERLAGEVARRRGLDAKPSAVAQARKAVNEPFEPGATVKQQATRDKTAKRSKASAPTERATAALDPATRALVQSGLSPDLVARFARIAARDLTSSAAPPELARATERGIAGLVPFEPLPLAVRCLFVVGPPGCGKTTTVAKLAARISRSDRAVLFAEADVERIGSLEQAALLSRCIGARAVRVETPRELELAIDEAGPRGIVLVDTPGIGASDGDRLDYIERLREVAPDAAVAVLVPAGLNHGEAIRVLRRFDRLAPSCVAFSRVDDGARVGELVTALATRGLPLSFLTTGHEPPDLEDASPSGLAATMLRNGPAAPAAEEARG